MLIYLDQAMKELHAERVGEGKPFTRADLNEAIMLGAVERVLRPKMMTVVAIMAGLLSDHVEYGHGLRGPATHRRADDRRHDLVDYSDTRRNPGRLRADQGV
jgi:hypothetical protein